ncbi:hypothetical protein LZ31DRAFT_26633 [Colletotrichum somersetense]|nr:hypothetical protein LZ31DRAFT_26633 [Colletotrichum somersetense]
MRKRRLGRSTPTSHLPGAANLLRWAGVVIKITQQGRWKCREKPDHYLAYVIIERARDQLYFDSHKWPADEVPPIKVRLHVTVVASGYNSMLCLHLLRRLLGRVGHTVFHGSEEHGKLEPRLGAS